MNSHSPLALILYFIAALVAFHTVWGIASFYSQNEVENQVVFGQFRIGTIPFAHWLSALFAMSIGVIAQMLSDYSGYLYKRSVPRVHPPVAFAIGGITLLLGVAQFLWLIVVEINARGRLLLEAEKANSSGFEGTLSTIQTFPNNAGGYLIALTYVLLGYLVVVTGRKIAELKIEIETETSQEASN